MQLILIALATERGYNFLTKGDSLYNIAQKKALGNVIARTASVSLSTFMLLCSELLCFCTPEVLL